MSLHHGDIVNLIKDSGYTVTLTIGSPLGKWTWCVLSPPTMIEQIYYFSWNMCLLYVHVNNLVPRLLSVWWQGHGLDDLGVRDFQASPRTHEFSCSLGTVGFLPWDKVAGGMKLTSVEVSVWSLASIHMKLTSVEVSVWSLASIHMKLTSVEVNVWSLASIHMKLTSVEVSVWSLASIHSPMCQSGVMLN